MEQKKRDYLKAFSAVVGSETYKLIGDCLLVEILKEPEKRTAGGIILDTGLGRNQVNGVFADKPTFVRVLLVGEGYYDDSEGEDGGTIGKDVPLDSKAGDIVLVGRTSIKPFSIFGDIISHGEAEIGLVREADVQLRFHGQVGYDKFFGLINSALEAPAVEQQ